MPNNDTAKYVVGGLLVAGAVTGAGYIAYRVLFGGSTEQDVEKALMEKERKVNELIVYVHRIQNESLPEEVWSKYLQGWQTDFTKNVNNVINLVTPNSLVEKITDTIRKAGLGVIDGLQVAVLVGAAFGAALIIKYVIKHIKGPPTFKCPHDDGYTFLTEAGLQAHLRMNHPVTSNTTAIAQAQIAFRALPSWLQVSIATESEQYNDIYQPWTSLSTVQLSAIAVAAAVLASWLSMTAPALIPVLLLV